VCVRGLPAASGYYLATGNYTNQRPEDDSLPVFSSDSWVRTGDVGIWTPQGQLKIVDRLKNLVKLKNGEYVAIAAMEECFRHSAFVSNRNGGVMVYADAETAKPLALVQASEYDVKRWADEAGEGYMSFEELCQNPRVIAVVTADLNALGQGTFRSGSGASRNLVPAPWAANVYMNTRMPLLSSHEQLATIALIPASWDSGDNVLDEGQNLPWTIENGLLTKQGTLNRKKIAAKFADVLATAKKRVA
jgi:long-chain acyl-CoA synthetase